MKEPIMVPNFSRRDILKFIGGSVAGIILTPVPWKLLDDTAIMTQTGPWIAKVPRGEFSTRFSTCVLCPAGCGLRARCVQNVPVSFSPVVGHPLSRGTLCAAGFAAHHLAFHPLRVNSPLHISQNGNVSDVKPVTIGEIQVHLQNALVKSAGSNSNGSFAILDLRPGRTASLSYRKLLAGKPNGLYLVSPSDETSTYRTLDAMFEHSYGPVGVNLDKAKLILSVGIPLLDGWGTPGRMVQLQKEKSAKIIQVETRRSRTAALADEWIPIAPKSETAFALGIANVIIRKGLWDAGYLRENAIDLPAYLDFVNNFPPERVASLTGVGQERIISLARELAMCSPSLVLFGSDPGGGPLGREAENALWGLNLLLGNIGNSSTVRTKNEIPIPKEYSEDALAAVTSLNEVADHSISALIIEGSHSGNELPWDLIEKKLVADNRLIVSMSPYLSGIARKADYLVPVPAHLESITENSTPFDSLEASYAISAPLLSPQADASDPVNVIHNVFMARGTTQDMLMKRIEAIRESGRGRVFRFHDGSISDMSSIGSTDEMVKILVEGGLWFDNVVPSQNIPRFSFFGKEKNGVDRMMTSATDHASSSASSPGQYPLVMMPFGYKTGTSSGQLSPIMTKLYQESGLRLTSKIVLISPVTAKAYGVEDGSSVIVETQRGSREVQIKIDQSAMPGVIHVAVGPDPVTVRKENIEIEQSTLAMLELDAASTWRTTQAVLRKV